MFGSQLTPIRVRNRAGLINRSRTFGTFVYRASGHHTSALLETKGNKRTEQSCTKPYPTDRGRHKMGETGDNETRAANPHRPAEYVHNEYASFLRPPETDFV